MKSTLTWHVHFTNNTRAILYDGVVENEQQIEEQRKSVLAFLEESGYDVVRCLGVLSKGE